MGCVALRLCTLCGLGSEMTQGQGFNINTNTIFNLPKPQGSGSNSAFSLSLDICDMQSGNPIFIRYNVLGQQLVTNSFNELTRETRPYMRFSYNGGAN